VIWGLVFKLSEMFPEARFKSKENEYKNSVLPYTLEELEQLEGSILTWMQFLSLSGFREEMPENFS